MKFSSLVAQAEDMHDGVDEVRYVHDGNNVLLETDGLGTVEAEFTYIPQAYAQVISQLRNGDSSF